MADEEVTIAPDNAEVAETENAETAAPQYVDREEYKKLQRVVSAKDKSERQLRKQVTELNAMSAGEGARWETTLNAVVSALENGSFDQAKQSLTKATGERQNQQVYAKALGELAEIVGGEENFNDDEKYKVAKELWYNNRVNEALVEARRVNTPETQSLDIEELTRTIKAGIMKDLGRVDTGGSTSATPRGGASSEVLSQVNTKGMSPKQLQEHGSALRLAMSKETSG
jgi:hypothetical protein